jgi:hypothetical protein
MVADNNQISQILNPDFSFVSEIERQVKETNVGYLDCIFDYCSKRNLEYEQVIHLIKSNPEFKNKIQAEAEALNLLKKLPPKKKPKRRKKKK